MHWNSTYQRQNVGDDVLFRGDGEGVDEAFEWLFKTTQRAPRSS